MGVIPPEVRAAAVAKVLNGGKLREIALEYGVSHEAIRQWAKDARDARRTEVVRTPRTGRKPIYVDGIRLGRIALWK